MSRPGREWLARPDTASTSPVVGLRPYGDPDFGLLRELLGDPIAMRHLGGAESDEQLVARHRRYLALDPRANWIFVIEADAHPVGWIGMWRTAPGICEAGWHVLAGSQGRGIATAALELLVDLARGQGSCRHLDAFPAAENAASNALCRAAGFRDLGQKDVEYPRGSIMHSNHWRLDVDLDDQDGRDEEAVSRS